MYGNWHCKHWPECNCPDRGCQFPGRKDDEKAPHWPSDLKSRDEKED